MSGFRGAAGPRPSDGRTDEARLLKSSSSFVLVLDCSNSRTRTSTRMTGRGLRFRRRGYAMAGRAARRADTVASLDRPSQGRAGPPSSVEWRSAPFRLENGSKGCTKIGARPAVRVRIVPQKRGGDSMVVSAQASKSMNICTAGTTLPAAAGRRSARPTWGLASNQLRSHKWWPDGSDGGLTQSRAWIGRRRDAPAHRPP